MGGGVGGSGWVMGGMECEDGRRGEELGLVLIGVGSFRVGIRYGGWERGLGVLMGGGGAGGLERLGWRVRVGGGW